MVSKARGCNVWIGLQDLGVYVEQTISGNYHTGPLYGLARRTAGSRSGHRNGLSTLGYKSKSDIQWARTFIHFNWEPLALG